MMGSDGFRKAKDLLLKVGAVWATCGWMRSEPASPGIKAT